MRIHHSLNKSSEEWQARIEHPPAEEINLVLRKILNFEELLLFI
jgi:hypothetical protein